MTSGTSDVDHSVDLDGHNSSGKPYLVVEYFIKLPITHNSL